MQHAASVACAFALSKLFLYRLARVEPTSPTLSHGRLSPLGAYGRRLVATGCTATGHDATRCGNARRWPGPVLVVILVVRAAVGRGISTVLGRSQCTCGEATLQRR
mmetsp:Transcript_12757/g.40325  ORF Transcript_12757/g.40325 Transcript_12757/m.40325 type:complete len:106 (-) Transcript_12757:547-864(-)